MRLVLTPDVENNRGRQNQLRVATDRSQFEAGKLITPHGAWFDHAGNIFVGEWVEILRVTKLRKVWYACRAFLTSWAIRLARLAPTH